MLIPVEADVDSEVTVLFVALRPVDNDVTPL
ncbi:PEST motif-containing protein [Burkholderia anthina]|nr:PEST motif-containing protein [Burkholderia anthina]